VNGGVVRRVTPKGEVSLFAQGFSQPMGIASDRKGNLYVANWVEKGFVSILTPEGKSRVLVPPEAGLVSPIGIVISPDNALLVSWGSTSVARIDPATGEVLNPHWLTGFRNPRQMTYDTSYRLYVADQLNNAVRRFDLLGTPVSLILRGAELTMPFGLVFDVKGDLYASQTRGRLIKRVQLRGEFGIVSDFADGLPNPGGIVFIG
jgi:streptogramin lyase